MRVGSKSWAMVACSILTWIVLFVAMSGKTATGGGDTFVLGRYLFCVVTAILAALPWLWFCHGQVSFLFSIGEQYNEETPGQSPARPAVAILYTTSDDFDAIACLSCLRQEYESPFRVVICDDGNSPESLRSVAEFSALHQVEVIRRSVKVREGGGFRCL